MSQPSKRDKIPSMLCLASANASSLRGVRVRKVERDKRGKVGPRGIHTHAPIRPLTPSFNLITAILAAFHQFGLLKSRHYPNSRLETSFGLN